jgi:hypothetical protein
MLVSAREIELPLPIVWDFGWAPHSVCTLWRSGNFLSMLEVEQRYLENAAHGLFQY